MDVHLQNVSYKFPVLTIPTALLRNRFRMEILRLWFPFISYYPKLGRNTRISFKDFNFSPLIEDLHRQLYIKLFLCRKWEDESEQGGWGKGGRQVRPGPVLHKGRKQDFSYGLMVKNTPTNAGDVGSTPGLGRSHMT